MEEKKVMDEFVESRSRQVAEELRALVSNRPDREVAFFLVVSEKDSYYMGWHGLKIENLARMFVNILSDKEFKRISKDFEKANKKIGL